MPDATPAPVSGTPTAAPTVTEPRTGSTVPVGDLVGAHAQAAKLTEWLGLALDEPELLHTLGASPHLGVLVTGPAGVGKSMLARSVLASRRVVELDGPGAGAAEAQSRLQQVTAAVDAVRSGGVLLITDIDALLPAVREPVSTMIIDQLRRAIDTESVAFVATTAHPESLDDRLRGPDLCDRELSLSLPDGAGRRQLLELLLRKVPTADLDLTEIASRTPGFVVADLAALCREAALRAASRASSAKAEPRLTQDDLVGALEVIRPLSRSGTEELAIGSVTSTTSATWSRPSKPSPRRCCGRCSTRIRSHAWASTRRAASCCTGRPAAARRISFAPLPVRVNSAFTPSRAPS